MPTILEDYFDFSEPEEIRIQGHRVWLHHVLKEYLLRDRTLEELCERFDTLTKEEILACLLYYHRNKQAMDLTLAGLEERFRAQRDESVRNSQDLRARMLQRKAEFDGARKSGT
jgi:uncharacterized protein (DUF433 family)